MINLLVVVVKIGLFVLIPLSYTCTDMHMMAFAVLSNLVVLSWLQVDILVLR